MRIPNRFATMFIVVALGALPIGVLYLFRNSEPEKTLFPKPVAAELSQKIGNPTTSLRHVALSDNRPRLPSCTEESVFSLDTIDRFDWRVCQRDLTAFWRSLRVPAGSFETSDFDFVESVTGDLAGDSEPERIVSIQSPNMARFLALQRTSGPGSAWVVLGYVDVDVWWEQAEGRVVSSGTGRWLAIRHIVEGHGTGTFSESERWFTLGDNGFVEVLSLPLKRILSLGGPGRGTAKLQIDTIAESVSGDEFGDHVSVAVTCRLGGLVDVKRRVAFLKGPQNPRFVFDESHSNVNRQDYEEVFVSADLTSPSFLRISYPELSAMASGKDSEHREWLRQYLEYSDDTPESQTLRKRLSTK